MQLTTIIGLLGALQGLVLAGAVASMGKGNRRPNVALALILFLFSVAVASIVLGHSGMLGNSIGLILLEFSMSFLFPPALWYYTDTVLGRRSRISIGFHLVPAGLWFAYLIAFSLGWLGRGAEAFRWLPPMIGVVIYFAAYTMAVAVRTWRHNSQQRTLVSHGILLRVLIGALFLLNGAQFVRYFLRDIEALSNIVPITGTVIIYTLSLLAFRQSRLFAGHETSKAKSKYDGSTLTDDGAERIREQLLVIMDRDKPYMNENLNVAELASRLSVPKAHLSQVINADLESSFPEFLNTYRVAEATRLLENPDFNHYTIEAIGYEVGFGSRSGFYGAFKRLTGNTPAQARDHLS